MSLRNEEEGRVNVSALAAQILEVLTKVVNTPLVRIQSCRLVAEKPFKEVFAEGWVGIQVDRPCREDDVNSVDILERRKESNWDWRTNANRKTDSVTGYLCTKRKTTIRHPCPMDRRG